MEIDKVYGQDAWTIRSNAIELSVTRTGGHIAPVKFFADTENPVQPYYINHWYEDDTNEYLALDPIIKVLRGNFFCLPFGGESVYQNKKYVTHGETANKEWKLAGSKSADGISKLHLSMETDFPQGKIDKKIFLVDGQNAIYTKHILNGYEGKFPMGYHATLALPEAEYSMKLFKSSWDKAYTPPGAGFFNGDEYSSLRSGKEIKDLSRVETIWKDPAFSDCTQFPSRNGYSDFIQICDSMESREQPAWTIALVPSKGYLWFSLKKSAFLSSTLLWISNGGRKSYPWNGINRCLGLEDICGFFAFGVKKSVESNFLSEAGVHTTGKFSTLDENTLNYIEGTSRIPSDFDVVEKVEFQDGKIIVLGKNDHPIKMHVNWEFLFNGFSE